MSGALAMKLPTRWLGSTGVEVGAVGLGAMGMSSYYCIGAADESESIRVLRRAAELGVTMLDTSNVYGFGENERLIGNVLKGGDRGKYFVATKFGYVLQEDKTVGVRGDAEHVREACEKSLKDLGVDTIDLYYQHRVDPKTRIEDTVKALAELQKEGKIRHIGLSGEVTADQIRAAAAVAPIAAVQLEWSLFTRNAEKDVIPVCRELGIGIVTYSPLGRGFLTGALKSADDIPADDFRKRLPRYQPENFAKNLELVAKVEEIAARHSATSGQIALAWLLAQGDDVIPIPGTKRLERLEENAAAAFIELSQQDLDELEAAFPHDIAAGSRVPDGW